MCDRGFKRKTEITSFTAGGPKGRAEERRDSLIAFFTALGHSKRFSKFGRQASGNAEKERVKEHAY
jgi:hypothetical protein